MTRDWEAQPFDVDLVEPGLGGAQSAEQPAAGPELGDELREGRPLGGLEAPAEPDQRPESVRRQVQVLDGVREAVREDARGHVVGGTFRHSILGTYEGDLAGEGLEKERAEGEDVVGGVGAAADDWAAAIASAADSDAAFPEHLSMIM